MKSALKHFTESGSEGWASPSLPKGMGYACTCNNPIGLQIKSNKKTKQHPQIIWISTSSSIISYRNEIFISTKPAKKGQVQLSWSILENMELILPPELDPRCQKRVPEKHIMRNDREVEMKKGKTFNTLSEGKAWQKKQRNSLSTQAALVWTGLNAVEITAGSQTRNTEVKKRGGETFFLWVRPPTFS